MLIYKFDYIRNIVYNQAKDKQKHTDFPQIGFPNIRIFLASTHCKPSFPKQPAVCAHPFSRKQLSSAKKGNRPSASCSHVSRWGVLFFHRVPARDRLSSQILLILTILKSPRLPSWKEGGFDNLRVQLAKLFILFI